MAAIEEDRPDLVLLDVLMPHVDGWEMLRRMQERYGTGAIPVVMFSGSAQDASRAEATSRGAQRIRREAVRPAAARRADAVDRADLSSAA